jgi:hypothetical protein
VMGNGVSGNGGDETGAQENGERAAAAERGHRGTGSVGGAAAGERSRLGDNYRPISGHAG